MGCPTLESAVFGERGSNLPSLFLGRGKACEEATDTASAGGQPIGNKGGDFPMVRCNVCCFPDFGSLPLAGKTLALPTDDWWWWRGGTAAPVGENNRSLHVQ